MLILLSPAKKLDYDTPLSTRRHTQPLFIEEAGALIDILKEKSASEIAALMKLSDSLANLNVERYRAWTPEFSHSNARQAILAFNGDVYEGLQATTLSDTQLQWAQKHVAILSGLYGILRPLDLMQPYCLEMGTRLANPRGANLYDWWGTLLSDYLNRRAESAVVLNLASEEYFKAVDRDVLKGRVVQCVFQDYKSGTWKIISFNAKRARGLMTRYIIDNTLTQPDDLKDFDRGGYRYAADQSSADRLVFRRKPDAS